MATDAAKVSSGSPLKDFEAVFPLLVDELQDVTRKYNIPSEAADWFVKVENIAIPSLSYQKRNGKQWIYIQERKDFMLI